MDQILRQATIKFGCDPEMFFATPDDKIVGAEKVLPASGVLETAWTEHPVYDSARGTSRFEEVQRMGVLNRKALVLDGVQVEMNPNPSTCRESLGNELALTFRTLKEHLSKQGDIKVTFNSVVTVDKKELEALSERARQFGCAPSLNYHDGDKSIKCNPATYLKRSAGGHIHIGLTGPAWAYRDTIAQNLFDNRTRLVPLMDAIVGNTCVLIDRHPEAAERRKVYGRAGEYRLPDHGLEYRTLSNFWLQSYQLFSFVMGLTRIAVSVLHTTLNQGYYRSDPTDPYSPIRQYNTWDAECDLMKRFDLKAVEQAINTNDFKLAAMNFKHLKAFVKEHVPEGSGFSLTPDTLAAFDHFVEKIADEGMSYWFPQEPMEHWTTLGNLDGNKQGWESFINNIRVGLELNKLFGREM